MPGVVYVAHVACLAVTLLDAALHALTPDAFVALTLKVYEVPQVRPVTVNGEDDPVAVLQPGVDVAVYVSVVGLPLHVGAVNVTDAQRDTPAVAVPIVGALGD